MYFFKNRLNFSGFFEKGKGVPFGSNRRIEYFLYDCVICCGVEFFPSKISTRVSVNFQDFREIRRPGIFLFTQGVVII